MTIILHTKKWLFMKKESRSFPAMFKAKAALEAVTGSQTLALFLTRREVHAARISNCKKSHTDRADELFGTSRSHIAITDEKLTVRLDHQIGGQSESSWLKKVRVLAEKELSSWIKTDSFFSTCKHCELVSIPWSIGYGKTC